MFPMKLLIVGFNARPIAKSAKKASHEIGVVDYFGDIDLFKLTNNIFSVLRQKPEETLHRPLHRTPSEYLYILSEIMIEEQGDFDGIILGSSFDRYPELVKQFTELGPKLYANSSEDFVKVRRIKNIQKLAQNSGFEIPKTTIVNRTEELIEEAKNQTFPLVTRSGGGGGGAGIRFWKNFEDLQNHFNDLEVEEEKEFVIQEYIEGIDASASVIATKERNYVLSINQQLIGDNNFNPPGDFAYCGNIVPLGSIFLKNKMYLQKSIHKIQELFSQLKLIGSNGIDFVIKNNELYFMEVNPRIQGSIECIEYATGRNIIQLHIESFYENNLDLPSIPKYKRKAIKGILFSNSEKTLQIKKYPKNKWIVDRTHIGVLIEQGDPICSIVLPSASHEKGYNKAVKLANKITTMNK